MPGDLDLGELLRFWREHVEMGQGELAGLIGYSASSLNQWETGKRRAPRQAVETIDRAMGAAGALVDLAFAIRTPATLPPSLRWVHNFGSSGGPVWAWIRPDTQQPSIRGRINWGPWRVELDAPWSRNGVAVTSPVSVANPPIVIELERPGWVDFGVGTLGSWLPIPVIEGSGLIETNADDHNCTLRVVSDRLVTLLRKNDRSSAELATFLGLSPQVVETVLGAGRPGVAPQRVQSAKQARDENSRTQGAQLRSLRENRGLSFQDVLQSAKRLPGAGHLAAITLHHLRVVEADQNPRVPHLIPRLDMIYRCDGALTMVRISRSDSRYHSAILPGYWIGPVWVRFEPIEVDNCRAELRWGSYRRPLEVLGDTTVSFRQSVPELEPLEVRCSHEWRVSIGIGVDHQAIDINSNWVGLDHASDDGLFDQLLTGLMKLSGREGADFERFLAGSCIAR